MFCCVSKLFSCDLKVQSLLLLLLLLFSDPRFSFSQMRSSDIFGVVCSVQVHSCRWRCRAKSCLASNLARLSDVCTCFRSELTSRVKRSFCDVISWNCSSLVLASMQSWLSCALRSCSCRTFSRSFSSSDATCDVTGCTSNELCLAKRLCFGERDGSAHASTSSLMTSLPPMLVFLCCLVGSGRSSEASLPLPASSTLLLFNFITRKSIFSRVLRSFSDVTRTSGSASHPQAPAAADSRRAWQWWMALASRQG